MTQRSAFVLRVRPERLTKSTSKRTEVFGQRCSHALRKAGIRNYTIFRHGNEMFGYFESDDRSGGGIHGGARDQRDLAGRDGRTPEARVPGAGPPMLEEIFRLD